MDFLIVLAALCFLMYVAYRGHSVILFAPVAALGAVLLTDPQLVAPMFTGLFMDKMVGFLKLYFPVFLLGAVFGKVIELSGFSKSIVAATIKVVGAQRAILSIVLVCALLTYGGVSLFVVVFAVYPFAAVGQQGADDDDRQDRAARAEQADRRGDDRLGEPRQLDHLAEDRAEQEHREVVLQEPDHLVHEQAGEHRRDQRRVGQQHRAQGGHRGEQDDAVAAVRDQHQEGQRRQHDQEFHGTPCPPQWGRSLGVRACRGHCPKVQLRPPSPCP